MAQKPMKIRAWMDGDRAMVKAIIFHPMETGLRKDKKTGKKIPEHFISEVFCKHGATTVLNCQWGTAVSKNPFMSFRFNGAKVGDTVSINWVDNQGNKESAQAQIK
ncbi:MAG: thiosulfate oxidation carrier complex protein SoxZ [Gammaproteobacteria bacterium]|nr:thiosulfate oxidation carrier complex protein SoxZ [Gammaproteobacteria bacterium]